MTVVSRALVLGSGEAIGFAWQWGVLTSLHDAGISLMDADLLVGTSVGSTAAVELTTGDPHRMMDHILTDAGRERTAPPATDAFVQMLTQAIGKHFRSHRDPGRDRFAGAGSGWPADRTDASDRHRELADAGMAGKAADDPCRRRGHR
ncbi:hypothetical protein [Kibdelosporangium aridum]|uniref:hypothetical protein n=1 Tax=Kibdelosporangium aridum TaxID=2030 RepID=UPI0035EEC2C3